MHTQPLVEASEEPRVQPDVALWRQVTVGAASLPPLDWPVSGGVYDAACLADLLMVSSLWLAGRIADDPSSEAACARLAQLLLEPHAGHHVRAAPPVAGHAGVQAWLSDASRSMCIAKRTRICRVRGV